jgi:hypothetical protein
MTDIVDPATRSRIMSGIRGKHTQPELRLRRLLHAEGFRFRLHDKRLPGKPDNRPSGARCCASSAGDNHGSRRRRQKADTRKFRVGRCCYYRAPPQLDLVRTYPCNTQHELISLEGGKQSLGRTRWRISYGALPALVVERFYSAPYCKLMAFDRAASVANIDFDEAIVEIIVS